MKQYYESCDGMAEHITGEYYLVSEVDARIEKLEKLLQEFYELNANGVFSLPDANYALITATAAALGQIPQDNLTSRSG